jgi:hypothetical protein
VSPDLKKMNPRIFSEKRLNLKKFIWLCNISIYFIFLHKVVR